MNSFVVFDEFCGKNFNLLVKSLPQMIFWTVFIVLRVKVEFSRKKLLRMKQKTNFSSF